MRNGMQYNRADLYVASFDPGIRPQAGQINNPPALIDRNSGRPGRINQWNISLQRQSRPTWWSRRLTSATAAHGCRPTP